MPTVRVYVPTYRRPAMLRRALASLRAQTFTDWVAEVHNDCPGDRTPAELVAALADSRLSVVEHPRNLGGTETFNLFFHGASEPFVSIHEDDNTWDPELLATLVATAGEHPEAQVIWANMRLAVEESDGSLRETDRTIWPESAVSVVPFRWGDARQVCGALHSNGAALFRSGRDLRIPAVPFGVIEAFRERLFHHPLLLVTRPLATFVQTRESHRSRDPVEWAVVQAMLAATFFRHCLWREEAIAAFWSAARAQQPPATTPLILAGCIDPRVRTLRRHASAADWLLAVRGLVRRPRLYFQLRTARRRHQDWWRFLEDHTATQWQAATLEEAT